MILNNGFQLHTVLLDELSTFKTAILLGLVFRNSTNRTTGHQKYLQSQTMSKIVELFKFVFEKKIACTIFLKILCYRNVKGNAEFRLMLWRPNASGFPYSVDVHVVIKM